MKSYHATIAALAAAACVATANAQSLRSSSWAQAAAEYSDTTRQAIGLGIDALAFFQNDEYSSDLAKGYTLPGFRLTPTLSYRYSRNASFEAGAYMMHYWGADAYPDSHYWGIPEYDANHSSKRVHALPFLRARLATDFGLTIVLGNLYGGSAHRLIAPLYFQEHDLTSDPEAGIQLIYSNNWIDADAWVDWRSFIYESSPYRENFVFGLSTRIKASKPSAAWQFTFPVQLLMEHYGGEIDATDLGIATLMNAAAGIKADYAPAGSRWRHIGAEASALISRQVAGDMWPCGSGWGVWGQAYADFAGLRASAGAFRADKFITLCGSPLLSTLSSADGKFIKKQTTAFATIEYTHSFAPGFTLGVNASAYHQSGTSYLFGASVRVNPSFILYRIKQ